MSWGRRVAGVLLILLIPVALLLGVGLAVAVGWSSAPQPDRDLVVYEAGPSGGYDLPADTPIELALRWTEEGTVPERDTPTCTVLAPDGTDVAFEQLYDTLSRSDFATIGIFTTADAGTYSIACEGELEGELAVQVDQWTTARAEESARSMRSTASIVGGGVVAIALGVGAAMVLTRPSARKDSAPVA